MEKRQVGRPKDPNSLSEKGVSHRFLLNEVDEQALRRVMKHYELGFTELMRTLIREAAHEMEMEPDYIAKQMAPNPPQMDEPPEI